MFNLGNTLKRSWQILWNYKALWIFAFLLALFSGSGGGGGSNGFQYRFGQQRNTPGMMPGQWNVWGRELQTWATQNVLPLFATPQKAFETGLWILGAIVGVCILFGLIAALVRYPTESAIIRMVNEHAATGTKVSFKQGWKLGWTHRAVTMFLIDLILSVPMLLWAAVVLTVVLVNLNTIIQTNFSFNFTPGTGGLIALFFIISFLVALIMIFLGILRQFFVRAAVIEGKSFGESFERGWQLFKQNVGHALLLWITLVGILVAVSFAMFAAFFVLIPAYAILAIPGAIVAAVPGAIALGIASIFAHPAITWIIAAIVAAPFFFIIVFSPLILISGLIELYRSNNWTLTYRQFAGMEQPPALPVTPPPAPAEPAQ